jgi:hypothetical protein
VRAGILNDNKAVLASKDRDFPVDSRQLHEDSAGRWYSVDLNDGYSLRMIHDLSLSKMCIVATVAARRNRGDARRVMGRKP